MAYCRAHVARCKLLRESPSELQLAARSLPCSLVSLATFRTQAGAYLERGSASASCGVPKRCSRQGRTAANSQSLPLGSLSAAHEDGLVWDVLGLGQAMVDFSATVDDTFLQRLGVEKGGRKIIALHERATILEMLDSGSYQISAGGSLANTLGNLGQLGQASASATGFRQPLSVAAATVTGSDALGAFHSAQQQKAGVATISPAVPDSSTGTVIVLTTPDANRTFLSYLGSSQRAKLDFAPEVMAAIRQSRLVTLEGYLWEMPEAKEAMLKVVDLAHAAGTVLALTMGDPNVVARHQVEIWDVLHRGVDILFSNRSEAEALLGISCSAEEAALRLGPHCSMVVVTDGVNGSCISAMGRLQVIPPFWAATKPVDTCGAGDGYAAGLLYGWLTGMDPPSMGRAGARVASAIIGRAGGSLSPQDAERLVEGFSSACLEPLDLTWAAGLNSS